MTTIPNAEVNKYFIDLHRALAQTEFRISVAKLLGTRVGDDVNTWKDIYELTPAMYSGAILCDRTIVITAIDECISEYKKLKSRLFDAFDTVTINGRSEPATLSQGWYGLMKYIEPVIAIWAGYTNNQPLTMYFDANVQPNTEVKSIPQTLIDIFLYCIEDRILPDNITAGNFLTSIDEKNVRKIYEHANHKTKLKYILHIIKLILDNKKWGQDVARSINCEPNNLSGSNVEKAWKNTVDKRFKPAIKTP